MSEEATINRVLKAIDTGNLLDFAIGIQDIKDINMNIERQNSYGTLLLFAVWEGKEEIVKMLVDLGASLGSQGETDYSPLALASESGYLPVVQVLIDGGADINGYGSSGISALQQACHEEHIDIVKFLLDKGADVNQRQGKDWSPLMAATSCGNVDIVRILMEHGADLNAIDDEGSSAIYLASAAGYTDIVHLLLNAGVDINQSYKKDRFTILQVASLFSNASLVSYLLSKGADSMARDIYGRTARDLAARHNNELIVELLESHNLHLYGA